MKKIITLFSLLLLVSCGKSYKITGKNFYKVGGGKYLVCRGNEYRKTCREEIEPIEIRYAIAFDNGMWTNISKEEYKKYNIGDTYKVKILQTITR
ncbi:hypothetical protein [Sebaldella sp. S0638]|uniref:hypothetical protein n=1 Tax=Sebaldella sp. S0638 TaxID=2957809 RepID=UPI00209D072B|nr:hypothetical protein [Sebaldella sp. S0638]MCP1226159.1 hypothetical protein [Sebaldella sp. S0638]